MIRRRRRPTSKSTVPLGHDSALDAVEKLRSLTPEKRAKEWAHLRPRIVAMLLSGGIGPPSASDARKKVIAESIAGLYLKHADGKPSFLPLRAPRAARLDDYRESDK